MTGVLSALQQQAPPIPFAVVQRALDAALVKAACAAKLPFITDLSVFPER